MFNCQLAENQDTTRRTKLMANYMAINVLLLYCAETIILSKRLSPVFVEFLSKPHRDLRHSMPKIILLLLLMYCEQNVNRFISNTNVYHSPNQTEKRKKATHRTVGAWLWYSLHSNHSYCAYNAISTFSLFGTKESFNGSLMAFNGEKCIITCLITW